MSLLSTIQSSGNALSAFEQAISTIQSNVSNASVDNYTAQTPALASTWSGVAYQGSVDARNSYAEQAVWDTSQSLGLATAQSDNLTLIQSQFDVSGSAGVPGALSKLYSAFSAWATSPTDSTARNQVLVAAKQVAQAFSTASSSLSQSAQQLDTQISNTIDQINNLSSQVASINEQIQNNGGSNPSLQAELYKDLQSFSSLGSVAVHIEKNGTATVLLNGQVPLVVGTTVSKLAATYPTVATPTNPPAPRSVVITANNGQNVTASASAGGQLAGLIQVRNTTIPSLIGDQTQAGSLNVLAKSVADRVNTILGSGEDSLGNPGKPLFTYTAGAPTATALSMNVDSTVAPSDLPALLTGPPAVANGVPNQLSGLSNSPNAADQVNGSNYTDYYSKLVADVGSQAANASAAKTSQTDQLTQAENLRSQISGISLNEQAAMLMQYQQAYQATSQLVSVVNSLTGYLMNMVGNN